jgi:hypothetical protein
LSNLVAILYNFPHFDILCQEKSGNPATEPGSYGEVRTF